MVHSPFKVGDIVEAKTFGRYGITDATKLYVALVVAVGRNTVTTVPLFSTHNLSNPTFSVYNAFRERRMSLPEVISFIHEQKDPSFLNEEYGHFTTFTMNPDTFKLFTQESFLDNASDRSFDYVRPHIVAFFKLLLEANQPYVNKHQMPTLFL